MTYTIQQVATLIGVSRCVIDRARKAGQIKFRPLPTRYGRVLQCERRELIGWLARIGFPLDMYRHKLAVGDCILACGLPTRLADALSGFRVDFTASPVKLGMLMPIRDPLAVVLSFDGIGRDQAMQIADEIRRDPGRPFLVAIVGDDESSRPGRAADRFDLILPNDVSERQLRRSMMRLRAYGTIEE